MSDSLTYWDDLEFVYQHYPAVTQALNDGTSLSAKPAIIPDSRFVVLRSESVKVYDVLPRASDGNLLWDVSVRLEGQDLSLSVCVLSSMTSRKLARQLAASFVTGNEDEVISFQTCSTPRNDASWQR